MPDSKVLSFANWYSIYHYYKRRLACSAFKIYHGQCSPSLQNLISKTDSNQSTRNAWRLEIPPHKYVDYKRSFKVRAATVWNNLPPKFKKADSYESFKKALKESDILERINFGRTTIGLARDLDFVYY